ncbi:50S ribosomal protein L18 [Candidatus Omnitrophota bacterium]
MLKKDILRRKRHRRILARIRGTQERPRLVVRRSLRHLHAQLIDDTKGVTVFSLSTADKKLKGKIPAAGNIKVAGVFGEELSRRAKEQGFTRVVFDRAGFLYHGRIKVFADSLRKGGLQF